MGVDLSTRFVRTPPNADAPDPGPYVQFPPWPEGRYLVRMAPAAPDAVAEVLESLPPSENPCVTRILLEAVQGLPDDHFRQLAPKCVEWMTAAEATAFADYFADEAAQARLARSGKIFGQCSTSIWTPTANRPSPCGPSTASG